MPHDKPTPSPALADRLHTEAAVRAAQAAAAGALRGVEGAAHAALDGVERVLFGKVGGAEEAVRDLEGESALDRARRHYGGAPAERGPVDPTEDPVARAQKQLDELKRLRAEPEDDDRTPVRAKTL